MKTWKNGALIAIIAIISTLAMIGCDGCEQEPPPFKTTFTITLDNGKTVTVKDTRTNQSKQLDELGIITRLTNALNENKEYVSTGLVIDVESTTEYPRFKAISATKMGANFTYVSADDEDMAGRMYNVLLVMEQMPVAQVGEVDGIPVYRVQGVTPEEAETALEVFEEAYANVLALDTEAKSILQAAVDTVLFVSGSEPTYDKSSKTLKVGINSSRNYVEIAMTNAAMSIFPIKVGEVNSIPIYQEYIYNFSETDVAAALEKFEGAYGDLGSSEQLFLDKVNTVHFVSGSEVTYDENTKTLNIGVNETADDMFDGIFNTILKE